MSNPLVADVVDSTTSTSGLSLVDSVNSTNEAIQNGDWLEAGLGTADLVMTALDPFAAIISNGVGWLLEHVGPLSDALDALAGSPDEIQAHADTWSNVANEVNAVSTELGNLIQSDVSSWTGAAADAYRERATDTANLILAAGAAAGGAAEGIQMAGEVVTAVRDAVRDIIADVVGSMVSWALQVLFTLGIGLAWVVPKVVAKVAQTAAKIAQLTQKLVSSMSKLSPLLKKLGDDFADAGKHLKDIKTSKNADTRSIDPPPSITPSGNTGGGRGPDPLPTPDNRGPNNSPDVNPSGNSGGSPDINPSGNRGGPEVNPSGNRGLPGDNPRDRSVPEENRFCESDPVDIVTGEMILTQTDLNLPGWLPLELSRTHVSSYRTGGLFGQSWASSLDQRIELGFNGPRYLAPDGMVLHYPPLEVDMPATPLAGPQLLLTLQEDGTHVLADRETGRLLYFTALPGSGNRLPLVSVEHLTGHRIQIEHDPQGLPRTLWHSSGQRVSIDISDHRVTRLRLFASENAEPVTITRYGYDRLGNLVEVYNSSGLPYRFSYDDARRIIGWQDRGETWYRYEYDADGRCIRTTGVDGRVSGVFHYDRDRLITTYTDALGGTKVFHLNDLGQVLAETDTLGNTTTFGWDQWDRLLTRTDALGNTTRQEWDAEGNLVLVVHPDGTRTQTVFNEMGLPVRTIEPGDAVHRWEYDPWGKLLAETDATGATITYGYDEMARSTTIRDALGGVTQTIHDARGLLIGRVDEMGNRTTYELDALGRVVTSTDPAGNVTRHGWTVENLPAWKTWPNGRTERWTYDGEGNCVEHVDVLGHVTRTEYGPFDLETARIAADGSRTEYAYDSELRLIAVTNPDGLTWRYEYDAAGRMVSETDFNGRTLWYQNDAAGRVIAKANAVGQVITYLRDAAGRVIEETADEITTSYRYDAAGRVVGTSSPGVETAFEYDALGRLISQSCNGATSTYGYDRLGRRIQRTTPVGMESVWTHDAAGRPLSLTVDGHQISFDHDATGEQTRRSLGPNATLTQTWDATERLRAQALTTAVILDGVTRGASVSQRRAYLYRADGEVVAVTDQLSGPREFTLDRQGRVIAVEASGWTEDYAYDGTGNIVNAVITETGEQPDIAAKTELPPKTTEGPRAYSGTLITNAGNVRYQHDAQGRVTAREVTHEDGQVEEWHYAWDSHDRLTDVLTPTDEHWRYRYDPEGRRIRKERRSVGLDGLNPGTVLERVDFIWESDRLIEQIHTAPGPDGELVSRIIAWDWEPDTFRVLTQSERTTAVGEQAAEQDWVDERFHHIVTDLVGSPTEMVDEDGRIVWHAHSSLWGRHLGGDDTAPPTPLRFPGQYHDDETGLHYNRHRFYDPTTGRYLSPDPLGLDPAPNHHSYVANPVTWSDPLGLMPKRKNPPTATGGGGTGNCKNKKQKPNPPAVNASSNNGNGSGGQPAPKPPKAPKTPQPVTLPAHIAADEKFAKYFGAVPDGKGGYQKSDKQPPRPNISNDTKRKVKIGAERYADGTYHCDATKDKGDNPKVDVKRDANGDPKFYEIGKNGKGQTEVDPPKWYTDWKKENADSIAAGNGPVDAPRVDPDGKTFMEPATHPSGKNQASDMQMGHLPGMEHYMHKQYAMDHPSATRDQFEKTYDDPNHYRLEFWKTNQSHSEEADPADLAKMNHPTFGQGDAKYGFMPGIYSHKFP
ncbi:RHS repeat-associated core domain-containing protein [Actinoalloteichus hymeniacidonis]|uniref:RHS repeat-associated core domain n=1 Tax=Actinoalloteichus hymeniacidonis TaxID=340345 RepID=A0AAC9MZ72_9PSEU|nr:RHS repeat-associated core domain-containing protein [Actinoalloteichus hymeniacidonis]AOS65113.1 RHS repeat-associated core domain [Actinoalloteichus hymeniacidonis]MBB5906808.1 RHS repeat-associated protein [Actinoalloteichus hymeniacidonis]